MNVPGVMDKDDAFFHRLTTLQKDQYQLKIEKWIQINKPTYLERINTAISVDTEHLKMVQACSRGFCTTELAQKTGFHFFCAEPLIEFGSLMPGNKSFDILLFNDKSKKAIFIECKSSIGKINEIISDIEQSIQLVHQKKKYLSERVQDIISWDDSEYILCITNKDLPKIEQSHNRQILTHNSSFDIKGFVCWVYHPYSDIIQVSEIFPHGEHDFNEIMRIGTEKRPKDFRLDLPYCITSHKYIIIEQAVIGKCYARQYANRRTIEDPKKITINQLMNEMMNAISLIVSGPVKRDMVKQRLDEVIVYGKKYDLFTEIKDESFRINCRGERPATVLEALKGKFIENWAIFHATRDAQSEIEMEMQETISQKEISDFD